MSHLILNQSNDDNGGANQMNLTLSTTNAAQLSPQEEALQSLCKQILKAKLFRGFYLERRFVQPLHDYRDIISLHRTERELEKTILDIGRRLEKFYAYSETPNIWVGITQGPLLGTHLPSGALETYIWVELDELAFGQYWFSIKSIRFRGRKEIIIKLKVVREVEDEVISTFTPLRQRKRLSAIGSTLEATAAAGARNELVPQRKVTETQTEPVTAEDNINIQDFIEIIQQWGRSIKQTVYDFMSEDVNKQNLKEVLRVIGLLLFSIMAGALAAIKFIGIFTLRFMFEFSRLMHVMTPILLKSIEVCNKIVGGFYILIAMIWRDLFGKKNRDPPPQKYNFREIEYNRPLYKAIKYDIQKNQPRRGVS